MTTLPQTYKAVQMDNAGGDWHIVDVPLRQPTAKEVLIKVHASGICRSDEVVKNGTWPGITFPRIAGHEVIGRVVAIGSELSTSSAASKRLAAGTLVGVGWNGGFCNECDHCRKGDSWTCSNIQYSGITIDGGHGEYVYATANAVVSIDEKALETMSYAELAPLCCAGATVFNSIQHTKGWRPGDVCVVQGVGGLGHLAIQYAKQFGLKVIAVSTSSSKKDLALTLGASEYLNAKETNVVEYVQALGGAKLIICTAPYSKSINALIPAVAKNGHIVLVSAAVDGSIEVNNIHFNLQRASLSGFACGCAPETESCIDFSITNKVKPIVKMFPIEDFTKAYNEVMDNTANIRNVIVFP